MHRIDTPNNEGGLFVSGNPVAGIQGTVMGSDWLNAIQEELAYVIEQAPASATLAKADNTQLRTAIAAIFASQAGREYVFDAPEDLTAGEGFLTGNVFGAVKASVLNGASATLQRSGTFSLAKNSGDLVTAGLEAFWNQTARVIQPTNVGSAVSVGVFAATQGGGVTQVDVLIGIPSVG